MRTGKYIVTSDAWKGLSRNWKGLSARLRLAAILTIALSAVSCRSKQEAVVQTSARYDSTAHVRTTVVSQGTAMPPRKAKLDIPMQAVAALPEKAVYMAKDGMVTVTLERKDSSLVIKAETDSLVPMTLVKTTKTLARKLSVSEEETKPPDKMGKNITMQVFILMGTVLVLAIWFENKRLK